jgi:hypothetical protein
MICSEWSVDPRVFEGECMVCGMLEHEAPILLKRILMNRRPGAGAQGEGWEFIERYEVPIYG